MDSRLRATWSDSEQEIQHARLVVYPGAGHGVHWEEPARFAFDVNAFAESLMMP